MANEPTGSSTGRGGLTRSILALALPALGALIAEPVFLLADTAIVGHLGVAELAGAGLGTTVVQTVVGLMIFLAYSTTPVVARWFGAGQLPRALAAGRDGLWLALLLGVVLAVAGWSLGPLLVRLLGSDGQVAGFALDYLRWSMPGLPAMLLVLAATGTLRGLLDATTPLVVAAGGFGLNIVANLVLVYGLGLSVAGSAMGTSLAQWAMAIVYLVLLVPRMRAADVGLAPSVAGLRHAAAAGSWLMLRTLSLRLSVLATVWVATAAGARTLAAHQIVTTLYSTLAFALDALAIAAQSLIGSELGAENVALAHRLTRTMVRWGLWFGVFTGAVLGAVAWWLPGLFTGSDEVTRLATAGLWVLALAQPVCGLVFVLDGILIGASDARYLAVAGVVALAAYLPLLALVRWVSLPGPALVWIWVAMAGYLCARAATLVWRIRDDRWMRPGTP